MRHERGFDWRMFLMGIGIAIAVMAIGWAWLYAKGRASHLPWP